MSAITRNNPLTSSQLNHQHQLCINKLTLLLKITKVSLKIHTHTYNVSDFITYSASTSVLLATEGL